MSDSSGGGRDGKGRTDGARYGDGDDEVEAALAASAASATSPTEEHLSKLVEMGYAEDRALATLLDAHGNFDQALDNLSTQTVLVRRMRRTSKSCTHPRPRE